MDFKSLLSECVSHFQELLRAMSECVSGLFMFTSHFSHSSRFFGRHFWVCHSLLSTHTYCWLQITTHSHTNLYSYSRHTSILYVTLECSGYLPLRCHFKATCNALSEVIFPVKQPEVKCLRHWHFRTVRSKLRNKLATIVLSTRILNH